jgi:hypothetical protein
MVATVTVNEITGTSGSKVYTPITNRVRLFSDDVATNQSTPQTTNPVVIPTSGFNYSYWKAVCLDLAGSGFTINNIRHYSAGDINWTFGTGGQLRRGNRDAGDMGCPDASYQQASGSAGVTGYAIEDASGSNGHAYYKSQTTPIADVNADLVGSPPVIDSTSHTSAEKTKHVVLQVKVFTDATQGTQTAKTLTWKYDES